MKQYFKIFLNIDKPEKHLLVLERNTIFKNTINMYYVVKCLKELFIEQRDTLKIFVPSKLLCAH